MTKQNPNDEARVAKADSDWVSNAVSLILAAFFYLQFYGLHSYRHRNAFDHEINLLQCSRNWPCMYSEVIENKKEKLDPVFDPFKALVQEKEKRWPCYHLSLRITN